MDEKLLNGLIEVISVYQSQQHLEVQDILELPRYKEAVQQHEEPAFFVMTQPNTLLEVLMSHQSEEVLGFIMIKGPEIVSFVRTGKQFTLFDSHPRKHLPGAHSIVFEDEKFLSEYVRTELFPPLELTGDMVGMNMEYLDTCEVTFLKVNPNAPQTVTVLDVTPLLLRQQEELVRGLQRELDQVRASLAEEQRLRRKQAQELQVLHTTNLELRSRLHSRWF